MLGPESRQLVGNWKRTGCVSRVKGAGEAPHTLRRIASTGLLQAMLFLCSMLHAGLECNMHPEQQVYNGRRLVAGNVVKVERLKDMIIQCQPQPAGWNTHREAGSPLA